MNSRREKVKITLEVIRFLFAIIERIYKLHKKKQICKSSNTRVRELTP